VADLVEVRELGPDPDAPELFARLHALGIAPATGGGQPPTKEDLARYLKRYTLSA